MTKESLQLRDEKAQENTTRSVGIAEDASVELTVVVPFFNPGKNAIHDTVVTAIAVLGGAGISFEIVAVSDGSTDGSEEVLDPLLSDSVRCLVLPVNGGKGCAVRAGLALGRGAYLGFIDGDGDLPPDLLVNFVDLAREHQPALIVGSKRHAQSNVIYPTIRRVYSHGYQSLVRLLFGLRVRDTQVGLKLIRRDVAQEVLPMMKENRFAFDLELLALVQRLGYHDIREAPVRINARKKSTVSSRTVVAMLRDTLGIFWRIRVRCSYDTGSSHSESRQTAESSLVPMLSMNSGGRFTVDTGRSPSYCRPG